MNKLRSEIGAESAWKGFSSQTLYIASRLLSEERKLDFYPETVEDLMLKESEEIVELVQIKNLKSNLSLSDLEPQKEDSFFKRVLKYKSDKLIPKIITFGDIGKELKGVLNNDQKEIKNVTDKLILYNYNKEDIDWLLRNLVIEKVNEKELERETLNRLKDNFSISASTSVFFSFLICYVSKLSRNGEKTNKEMWNMNVNNIIESMVSIDSIHKQYGRTLFCLSSFTTDRSIEQQKEEYRSGFDAKPYYIRNDLDIYRKKWIDKIDEAFQNNNIVIIRGLSGQGKSTIAYRYLINNYNENSIFVVKNLSELKEAKDIISVIEGLSINEYSETIIYLDITPYDKSWKIILDHIKERETKVKVLITIREEDYKRNNMNTNLYDYNEIELILEKDEAEEIYNIYNSKCFLNFEDAWKKFGEKGPFMEFIYLLSKNEKLVDKLENQIDNIIENEENSDEWLKFLLIISLAGKDNFSVSFEKVSRIIDSKFFTKILKNAQKEYLIKVDNESNYIQATHALRASIIVDLIYSKIVVDKELMVINTLECTKEFYPSLIVEHIKDGKQNVKKIIEKMSLFEDLEWSCYASIIRAILWYDTYNIYMNNIEKIRQYNSLTNNNFILLFLVDITNVIEFNRNEQIELLKSVNQEMTNRIIESINFDDFILDYKYTDILLEKIFDKIANKSIGIKDNYSYIGYILFWLGNRNKLLEQIEFKEIDYSKISEVEDLLIGLKIHNLDEEYNQILEKIKKQQIIKNNIIEINENDVISVKFINDIFEGKKTNFDKVMDVVYSLKRTYYGKRKYNVRMIGEKLIDGIEALDIEKNIENDKLPLSWAVDINSQFLNIDNYNNSLENWDEYKECLDKECEIIYQYISKFNTALDYYYRKGNTKRLIDNEFNNLRNELNENLKNIKSIPKCAMNMYSLENSLYSFRGDNKSNVIEEQNTLIGKKLTKFINTFNNFFNQWSSAIFSKINNKKDKIEKFSIYSLIDGTKSYIEFMLEYKKQFEYNELIDKLCEELKVLVLFWNSFIEQPFIYNKSKLYEIKEIKKCKDKKFIEFIDDNINKYKFEENGKACYKIDIENNDKFYGTIYKTYSKFDTLSYESILLTEFDLNNDLNILYTLDGKNIHISVKMNLNSVLNYSTLEAFVTKSLVSADYQDTVYKDIPDIEENNILYNFLLTKEKIKELKIYFNHIISVNSMISNISEECLDVYDNWKDKMSNLLEDEIYEIIKICNTICNEVNVLSVKEKFKIFIGALKQLKDLVNEIVLVKEEKELPKIEEFEKCLLVIANEI